MDAANMNGQCEGDSCPGGAAVVPLASQDCTPLQYVILFTTGVTCVALLLDLAKRYLFSPKVQKDKATITDEQGELKSSELNGNYTGFKVGFEGGKTYTSSTKQTYVTNTSHSVTEATAGEIEKDIIETFDAVDSKPTQSVNTASKPLHEQTILEAEEQVSMKASDVTVDKREPDVNPEVTLMVDDLLTALRTSLPYNQSSENMPENCKENALRLDSLKELFMALVREVDDAATEMVSLPTDELDSTQVLDVLAKVENETTSYKKCWLGLRRLLFCVDIHIRNSSHYQVFHHECDRLQSAIEKYSEELKSKEEEDAGTDMTEAVKEIEKVQSMLKLWGDAIARLCDQSKGIYPVHLRTEELRDDTAARALVCYNTDKVNVNEGDIMLLVDNTDSEKWKLLTTSGQEVELPAVCCVIPPPDLNTMKNVGRIETAFKELHDKVQDSYSKRLDEFSKQLMSLLSTKDLTSISKEQRKELLEQIAFLEVFLGKFHKDGQSQEMLDRFSEIRTKIAGLEDDEGDAVMQQLLGLFSSWVKVANMYETSVYDKEKRKLLVKQGIILDAEDTEWETLAELEAARKELSLAVSVQRETMAIAEATKYERATGETRQTFSVTGVLDTRDNSELSMIEAIEKGIISQTDGTYTNMKTGESFPIPVAMEAGLILVSSTKTTKTRELKKCVGVITVEFKRETRPYNITHVLDPVSMEQIFINDAIDQGLFNKEKQVYINTESGQEITIENAIDSGYLIVEYGDDANTPDIEPEVTKKTFTVSSALDRKTGKQYQFQDAVDRGLIDKDAGTFHDTLTDQKINIVEAFQRKFMKGNVVANAEKIDHAFLVRQRSASIDSQTSESSKTDELE